MLLNHKNQLIASLRAALNAVANSRGIELDATIEPRLERPKSVDHGDIACNIALQIAKAWKMNPRELGVRSQLCKADCIE
jgi:arginyl-tRNA synthetase